MFLPSKRSQLADETAENMVALNVDYTAWTITVLGAINSNLVPCTMYHDVEAKRRYETPCRNSHIVTTQVVGLSQWLNMGCAMASWLVRSSPDQAVQVPALDGDIVLCSWARHFTLTVSLSIQVYKWVPANLTLGGNPAMD